MSHTRVIESRPYDSHYDPVYTGPYNNVGMDPRVRAAVSSTDVVSGTTRFKYFRRPIMPRISAVPPNLLLAPTSKEDPMVPIEEKPEPAVKNVEIQTMYRESEVQTVPYTPDYFVPEGEDPEVLMLTGLTHGNGLPLGQKEIEMIEHARAKRELEFSMPPFTDEACLAIRKKMMEMSELKEYKLREKEIDSKRDGRLLKLTRALNERDESNEFLASQRIEALRQSRMDEREKVMQKIRKKRVKVLRRLARQRNTADPVLSTTVRRDIINDYFDAGSSIYAPLKRDGRRVANDSEKFDIVSRTVPLNNVASIVDLETTIPRKLTIGNAAKNPRNFTAMREMSMTAPPVAPGGGRAAQPRLTSSAHRVIRNTKRDVEVMHGLLNKKKHARNTGLLNADDGDYSLGSPPKDAGSVTHKSAFIANNKPKGRPSTPDFSNIEEGLSDTSGVSNIQAACITLQRLLRGRAIQNSMFEGRFRRRELINELRAADSYQEDYDEQDAQTLKKRSEKIRETTVDAVAGAVSTNLISFLAEEQNRLRLIESLKEHVTFASAIRLQREAAEGGRRQREGLAQPNKHRGSRVMEGETPPSPSAVQQEEVEGGEVEGSLEVGTDSYSGPSSLSGTAAFGAMPHTPPELLGILQTAAAERVSVDTVLEDLDAYPSLINSFRAAVNREHQEQICRDLVNALESPRYQEPGSEEYLRKEQLVQDVLARLERILAPS